MEIKNKEAVGNWVADVSQILRSKISILGHMYLISLLCLWDSQPSTSSCFLLSLSYTGRSTRFPLSIIYLSLSSPKGIAHVSIHHDDQTPLLKPEMSKVQPTWLHSAACQTSRDQHGKRGQGLPPLEDGPHPLCPCLPSRESTHPRHLATLVPLQDASAALIMIVGGGGVGSKVPPAHPHHCE